MSTCIIIFNPLPLVTKIVFLLPRYKDLSTTPGECFLTHNATLLSYCLCFFALLFENELGILFPTVFPPNGEWRCISPHLMQASATASQVVKQSRKSVPIHNNHYLYRPHSNRKYILANSPFPRKSPEWCHRAVYWNQKMLTAINQVFMSVAKLKVK